MEKYIKRLVRWAFSYRVRVYQSNTHISRLEEMSTTGKKMEYLKVEIAHKMLDALLKDGMIEIEQSNSWNHGGTDLRAYLRVIK